MVFLKLMATLFNLVVFLGVMYLVAMALIALTGNTQRANEFHTWKRQLKALKARQAAATWSGDYHTSNTVEAEIRAHQELKPDVPFWAFWLR